MSLYGNELKTILRRDNTSSEAKSGKGVNYGRAPSPLLIPPHPTSPALTQTTTIFDLGLHLDHNYTAVKFCDYILHGCDKKLDFVLLYVPVGCNVGGRGPFFTASPLFWTLCWDHTHIQTHPPPSKILKCILWYCSNTCHQNHFLPKWHTQTHQLKTIPAVAIAAGNNMWDLKDLHAVLTINNLNYY